MQNWVHLFKSRKFLPLFITQFFGAFNDNVFKNAFLIWFTYDLALSLNMNAQIMVSIASGLFILPFFLLSALAGSLADKYEKSKLVRIIKCAEIIIMICAFLGFYFANIYLLLFLTFAMGAQSSFFGPIKYSLLPEHLKSEQLVSGNALIEGGTFLAILLGTILGGIVIRLENGVFIISTLVIFLAIIGYLASRLIPVSIIRDNSLKIDLNILASTMRIISFAKREHTVWLAIIAISWFWFIGISFLSQFPIYTKNIINGDEYIVTLFLAIFSIGIGLGSSMCNKLLQGQINGRLVPFGSIGISLAILLFYLASKNYQTPTEILSLTQFLNYDNSYLIIASLLFIAIFSGIYIVPLYAIMQHRSDKQYLSRIIAANNVLNALFMVFATGLIIILAKMHLALLEIFLLISLLNLIVFYFIRKIVKQNLAKYV